MPEVTDAMMFERSDLDMLEVFSFVFFLFVEVLFDEEVFVRLIWVGGVVVWELCMIWLFGFER